MVLSVFVMVLVSFVLLFTAFSRLFSYRLTFYRNVILEIDKIIFTIVLMFTVKRRN